MWQSYCDERKRTKKYMVGKSAEISMKKLARYPVEVSIAALEASIAGGYQGIFPESVKPSTVAAIKEQKPPPDPEKLQSRHNPRCWLYKSEWPIVQAHIDRHQNDMHPKTYELAKMEFAKMAPGMQDDIAEMAFQHRTGLEMKLP